MKNLLSLLLLTASFTVSSSASAFEKLVCESANIKIIGNLQTRYLRMGHSSFNGDLSVFFYNQRKIVNSINVKVFSGDIQDMISVDTSMARTERGEPVTLEMEFDRPSTLRIGKEIIQFQPHCEIEYNQKNSAEFSSHRQFSNVRYYCSRPKPGFNCDGTVSGR